MAELCLLQLRLDFDFHRLASRQSRPFKAQFRSFIIVSRSAQTQPADDLRNIKQLPGFDAGLYVVVRISVTLFMAYKTRAADTA
jgi:hypothetical protein